MASLLLTLLFLAPVSLAGENSIILAESQRVVQRRMDTGDTRVLVTATQTDTVMGYDFRAIAVDDNFNFYVSVGRKVFRVSYFKEWAKLPTTDDIAVILVGRYVVGLEYDRQSRQLFGLDLSGIFKMNPNGSDVEVVTTFEEYPGDVVISGGFLYWNTWTSDARDNIFRCPIDDCSNPERLHDTAIDMNHYGFDVNGDCVIWADVRIDQFVVTDVLTGSETNLTSRFDIGFVDIFSISFNEGALYYTDWIKETLNVCYLHNSECFNIMWGLAAPRDFEFTSPVDGSSCSVLYLSDYSTPDSSSTITSTMASDSSEAFVGKIADRVIAFVIGVAAGVCSVDLLVRIGLWIFYKCCAKSTESRHERTYGTGQSIEESVSSAPTMQLDTLQLHSMEAVSTQIFNVKVENGGNLHLYTGAQTEVPSIPNS